MRDESLGTWASEFYHSHTWDTAEATPSSRAGLFLYKYCKAWGSGDLGPPGHLLKSSDSKEGHVYVYL